MVGTIGGNFGVRLGTLGSDSNYPQKAPRDQTPIFIASRPGLASMLGRGAEVGQDTGARQGGQGRKSRRPVQEDRGSRGRRPRGKRHHPRLRRVLRRVGEPESGQEKRRLNRAGNRASTGTNHVIGLSAPDLGAAACPVSSLFARKFSSERRSWRGSDHHQFNPLAERMERPFQGGNLGTMFGVQHPPGFLLVHA